MAAAATEGRAVSRADGMVATALRMALSWPCAGLSLLVPEALAGVLSVALLYHMVAPALGLVYLLGAPLTLHRRLLHLSLAAVVLLMIALSWAVIVDLTPAAQRPFVSDSGTNSELSLALRYNGLGRLTQALFSGLSGLHLLGITLDLKVVPAFAPEIGDPGPFRLLSPTLGSQVSWLLPLALFGLVAAATERRPRHPSRSRHPRIGFSQRHSIPRPAATSATPAGACSLRSEASRQVRI